ncbi:two-component system sensor histidine kinase MtrB [Actinomadura pelletieri DSM 43383]|uniref:histidine kinase n=1 Tax=Actinomadura pelletieri DSM 43383 TaxID=1120940 RepID=A0A495QPE7_9ACTN|nr:HAMP domain-containing sensor histidine kinase [Actinomadura pelletieri]RKS74752.1 two-component system sensor histidine kinase MtrB [Actinomadura pelletieri DSM 43383]
MIGLRPRLTAAFTAVALLAALLASGISYVLLRRVMLHRAQDTVLTDVRKTLTRQVPAELPPDVTPLIGAQLEEALEAVPGRKAAAVPMRLDGGVDLPPRNKLDVPVTTEFARRAMNKVVFQRVLRDGVPYLLVGARLDGYVTTADEPRRTVPPMVYVSASLSREAADLRLLTNALVVADALALASAVVLALLATRGVLRPVRRLGVAARALGEGDLETRVEVRGRGELADLARTFNGTADALERTVTELRAMEAASRRFVADVSHELRTPLTSMIAATDVLAEQASADGDADGGAARLVADETRRLGRLVEHLIEISRFDAGAAVLVLDDVNVLDAVVATLAARGWRERVTVEGPADLFARLDPRRFDVVLANLAGNALKHGRPPVSLRFDRVGRAGVEGVEVVVTDRGPGLPDDLIAVVFDRFVKAEAARSRSDGSGLGLSIARENAVLHGGTLEAANDPDGGAVFTLWLPAGPEEEPA